MQPYQTYDEEHISLHSSHPRRDATTYIKRYQSNYAIADGVISSILHCFIRALDNFFGKYRCSLATGAWCCDLIFSASKKILFWGEKRNFHETMRIKNLQQGSGGIRDIKVMRTEQEFFDQFNHHNHLSAKFLRNSQ